MTNYNSSIKLLLLQNKHFFIFFGNKRFKHLNKLFKTLINNNCLVCLFYFNIIILIYKYFILLLILKLL